MYLQLPLFHSTISTLYFFSPVVMQQVASYFFIFTEKKEDFIV